MRMPVHWTALLLGVLAVADEVQKLKAERIS
jgi:hypothetical protein